MESESEKQNKHEVEEVEKPDDVTAILAYIRQLKATGVKFRSTGDTPDATDPEPMGKHFTMFSTTSRFGG